MFTATRMIDIQTEVFPKQHYKFEPVHCKNTFTFFNVSIKVQYNNLHISSNNKTVFRKL